MLLDPITDILRPGAPGFLMICVLGYLMFAGGLTYALFGIDKHRSLYGDRRIPEASLLTLAALGGWPGAKLAQVRFHHKTRTQPFGTVLNLIAAGQVVVLLAQLIPVADAASAARELARGLGGPAQEELIASNDAGL